MRRAALILLGLALVVAGFGVLAYRVHNDPSIVERYERTIMGADGAGEEEAKPAPGEGSDRYVQEDSQARTKSQREDVGGLQLLEIVLDFANVLVGLIGISLAVSGMRGGGRKEA